MLPSRAPLRLQRWIAVQNDAVRALPGRLVATFRARAVGEVALPCELRPDWECCFRREVETPDENSSFRGKFLDITRPRGEHRELGHRDGADVVPSAAGLRDNEARDKMAATDCWHIRATAG